MSMHTHLRIYQVNKMLNRTHQVYIKISGVAGSIASL